MTKYFINRRRADRRLDEDRCSDMSLDLFHRKRRKSTERRASDRDVSDDYYAFMDPSKEQAEEESNDDIAGSKPLGKEGPHVS